MMNTGPMRCPPGAEASHTSIAYSLSKHLKAGITVIVNLPVPSVPPLPRSTSSPSPQIPLGPQSRTSMHVLARPGRPKPITDVEPASAIVMMGPVGVGVAVGVAVAVRVGVTVGVFVGVRVGEVVGVFVGVRVGVLVGVHVGVFVGVDVGVLVGVLVGVRVGVSVGVGVCVGVLVGVLVGVDVGVSVGVLVGVLVAVGVKVEQEPLAMHAASGTGTQGKPLVPVPQRPVTSGGPHVLVRLSH